MIDKIYIPTIGRNDRQITWNNLPQKWKDKTVLVVDSSDKDIKRIKIYSGSNKDCLYKILKTEGNVEVIFEVKEKNKKYTLKLKKKRFVDKNILNSIKNQGISASIF